MTTFWFGSRWALTRLACCPVIQRSRTILRRNVKTSPFSGWRPPWRGSERGPRLGSSDWLERGLSWLGSWWALWLGGRPTTPTSSWTKSKLPNRSFFQPLDNSCCCRAAKLLHGAHSRFYIRGERVVLCSWMRWCWRWVRFLSGSGLTTNMAAHIYGSDGSQVLETWEMPLPPPKNGKQIKTQFIKA